MLEIYNVVGVGQNVAHGPYRVLVNSDWLRALMKKPHRITDVTSAELNRIPIFPDVVAGLGGGGAQGFSDADLQRIAKAVADEQARRLKE